MINNSKEGNLAMVNLSISPKKKRKSLLKQALQKHVNIEEETCGRRSNLHENNTKKCKFCSTKFESVNEYHKHIKTDHKGEKHCFMCSVCGKQYKTKGELTHHTNSKCGTLKQYKCKICHQELMSAGSLYNHMLRHNGQRSFMCRFCAKLFFTGGQLKVHERIHTQDKAYVCEVCNKGFCHRQSLITHSTLHTGIKPFQCENCGNSFSCVGNLIKHRRTHSDSCGLIPLTTHRVKHPSTKIKVKINTPANSRLKSRDKAGSQLEREMETLKTELEKNTTETETTPEKTAIPKQEAWNDDENSQDSDLKEERISEQEEEEEEEEEEGEGGEEEGEQRQNTKKHSVKKKPKDPNYERELELFNKETNFEKEGYGDCKYCGKRYLNVRWLFRHVKDHGSNVPNEAEAKTGLPLHKCSCCKKSFFTKEECLAHQRATHADILTCQDCDKIFANRDSLRSHQKVFHSGVRRKNYLYICDKCGKQFKQRSHLVCHEENACDRGPSFECSVCGKRFSSRHTRNNHVRVHDPDKKLLCRFCGKGFHWKGQRKIHERSHTGEKPFACLYCPKAFAYRESLITHSTIHTGIKPHLCEGCGSRFSCIGNLIKHRSSHASECGAWTYKAQLDPK